MKTTLIALTLVAVINGYLRSWQNWEDVLYGTVVGILIAAWVTWGKDG